MFNLQKKPEMTDVSSLIFQKNTIEDLGIVRHNAGGHSCLILGNHY